jgi:hypothetical protein
LVWAARYGLDGPAIGRKVITASSGSDQVRIEVYEPLFTLFRVSNDATTSQAPTFSLSASETFSKLRSLARETLQLDHERQIRIWRLSGRPAEPEGNDSTPGHIRPADVPVNGSEVVGEELSPSSDLREAQLDEMHSYLAVEQQDADGNWLVSETPAETSTPRFTDYFRDMEENNRSAVNRRDSPTRPQMITSFKLSNVGGDRDRIMTRSSQGSSYSSSRPKGLVGLQNLCVPSPRAWRTGISLSLMN